MDNCYFIYSNKNLEIERFHLCTWEFNNGSALLEIGCEISSENLSRSLNSIVTNIYIPWLTDQNKATDLFSKFKESANAKFIFNDSVSNTQTFDGGRGVIGVLHEFQGREPLCILPADIQINGNEKNIKISLDLSAYNNRNINANIYLIGTDGSIWNTTIVPYTLVL